VRIPPEDEWSPVDDSTLVRAVAYDAAAERIFVRLIPRGLIVFEECTQRTWELFRIPGTSPGDYVTRVLGRHPHTRF